MLTHVGLHMAAVLLLCSIAHLLQVEGHGLSVLAPKLAVAAAILQGPSRAFILTVCS